MGDERSEILDFMREHGLEGGDEAAKIGSLVVDNNHLRAFIKAIRPVHRREAYEAILPHLRFKAKPFWWLLDH